MMGLLLFVTILVSSTIAIPVRHLDQRPSNNDEVQIFASPLPEVKANILKTDCNKKPTRKHNEKESKSTIDVKDSPKSTPSQLSIVTQAIGKNPVNDLKAETAKDRFTKKGRKHKAIFVNYPFLSEVQSLPEVKSGYQNYEEKSSRNKQYSESNVYYIKLPPTPYVFVPGLGYISQPPSYSFPVASKRPIRPVKRPSDYQNRVTNEPFVKVPIDFVSNGKPTSVYQYPMDLLSGADSHVMTLDKGPYVFNGNPVSLYLLRPDGRPFLHRTFRYSDYSNHPELEYQNDSYY